MTKSAIFRIFMNYGSMRLTSIFIEDYQKNYSSGFSLIIIYFLSEY
ncbi:hypothetical protein HMPREF1246_1053 [Acidaminococcus sp. BV3L6]|nr:hypothetical protein HMPREF1246_1053 [Acidaminococcus sp. BV3L6]